MVVPDAWRVLESVRWFELLFVGGHFPMHGIGADGECFLKLCLHLIEGISNSIFQISEVWLPLASRSSGSASDSF